MSELVSKQLSELLKKLREEQVIAYPTEAVFGLGCDPDSEVAVNRLLQLKQRPWEKGLILIAADFAQVEPYIDVSALSYIQQQRMFSTWPGPVTWVIPAKAQTPKWLTGQFSSLAVRVSDHPLVKQLCLAFGKPLVSTSANLSGEAPCRTAEDVLSQFGKNFPVLSGKVGGRLNPSEIRDALTGAQLRRG
ncbi:L-threonylcarbamoyladenylate synthase type 1 TsaC [Musicola paradisiaca]|uniref:Threonylcarbamoyl-AMP synthase n=1 Tax=Musicola paradisiaca (strain Ech703) TaxID=579405 RepID=C6C8N4_MUSP7|nr:L-threonylcarbamoyladenylate synthase type 1 TsaC [Musicola paradisiaca]ACS84255.1 SUA5/yciO/yrdC domain protein [Musicola paradisiaca Ech703]